LVGTTSSIETNSVVQAVSASNSTVILGNTNISSSGEVVINFAPSNSIAGGQIKCIAEEDFSTGANRSAFLEFNTRKDGNFINAMRLAANGRVGIGRTDPEQLLHLSSTNTYIALSDSADSGAAGILFRRTDNDQNRGSIIFNYDNDFMAFRASTNGSGESMRIDSDGRLLLGTTTEGVSGGDRFTIGVAGNNNAGMTIRSGTSTRGAIYFADGTSGTDEYQGFVEYLQGSAGYMRFGTAAVEQMRIGLDGAVTKPNQPAFYVQAGRVGDGYTTDPYQFLTEIYDRSNCWDGTDTFTATHEGIWLFTCNASYKQTGSNQATRLVHMNNAKTITYDTYELQRLISTVDPDSHSGGAGSCTVYLEVGQKIILSPAGNTPYHLNSTLCYFTGYFLG
jgi:hypothetical protein